MAAGRDGDAVRQLTAFYSASAEAYEESWAAALHPAALRLLEMLPMASAGRVLDLGSGVGTLLPALAQSAPTVGRTVPSTLSRTPRVRVGWPVQAQQQPRQNGTSVRLRRS